MGAIGNVLVNTIVRMFTRKALGRAIKPAKKQAKASRAPRNKAKGN